MFERFGNGRNIEIIINDELLKMLIELQNQFTKLKEMDNDKYKGEDIELPYFVAYHRIPNRNPIRCQ